jgi:hypothetical protein
MYQLEVHVHQMFDGQKKIDHVKLISVLAQRISDEELRL